MNYYGNYYNPMMNNPMDNLAQLRTQYQQPKDERIWVQGEASAMAYVVPPNGFVRLWDSQVPVFYEKRADASGRPYMETYEYTHKLHKGQNGSVLDNSNAIDYGETLNALEKRICALEQKGEAYVQKSDADGSAIYDVQESV